jgi:hypothetical protein
VTTNYKSGKHEITLNLGDIKNAASGIYIYSINAVSNDGKETFQQTRKMVFLK